jgi:hypothetical protein
VDAPVTENGFKVLEHLIRCSHVSGLWCVDTITAGPYGDTRRGPKSDYRALGPQSYLGFSAADLMIVVFRNLSSSFQFCRHPGHAARWRSEFRNLVFWPSLPKVVWPQVPQNTFLDLDIQFGEFNINELDLIQLALDHRSDDFRSISKF